MSSSALTDAIQAKNYEMLRAAMVGELVPVIAGDVDPQTWDPRELGSSGGNVFQAVIWQERIWYRDEESTDDHDEITVITLADGVNYLTNDIRFPQAVESRLLTEPPEGSAEPLVGEAWLVAEGGAGVWADHDGERAMLTARGWRFRPGEIGDLLYIKDPADLGFIHFNADDEWEDGVGPRNLIDGSVLPRHLLIRDWAVEDQTTTAPPANGPAGEQYVIGPAATGPWSGEDGKIAWRPATDAAFVITPPFPGEVVWDKSENAAFRWSGLAWVSAGGSLVGFKPVLTQAAATLSQSGSSYYQYSGTVAPTTARLRYTDPVGIAYAARSASNYLRLRYKGVPVFSTGVDGAVSNAPIVIGVRRGSDTNFIQWKPIEEARAVVDGVASRVIEAEFVLGVPDTDEYTYTIAFFMGGYTTGTLAAWVNQVVNRELTIEELIAG